jgi:hypothetical protein
MALILDSNALVAAERKGDTVERLSEQARNRSRRRGSSFVLGWCDRTNSSHLPSQHARAAELFIDQFLRVYSKPQDCEALSDQINQPRRTLK